MNDDPVADDMLETVASAFGCVAAEFADEIGGVPTLGEFLEVVGWAIPANGDATHGAFVRPLKLTATLAGNKQYHSDAASRVAELNDHVFEEASVRTALLLEQIRRANDASATPKQFASALLKVLRTSKVELADVRGDELRTIVAAKAKRPAKLTPGDVLAIPVPTGYRIVVVITRNQFGTALGLFEGLSRQLVLDTAISRRPREYPVYTEESLVKDGRWTLIGHDENLLSSFPADPEIYHQPNAWPGIVDTGEFGAAETATGSLRMIDVNEAREVGLQDGTYRQTYTAAYLQKVLGEG